LSSVITDPVAQEAQRELARRDPAFMIEMMTAWDERETTGFQFNMSGEGKWGWQAEYYRFLQQHLRTVTLKSRQLGVTWIAAAEGVTVMLLEPGSLGLVYRQKEEESAEVIGRMWVLFNSLPRHMWMGAKVIKPAKGAARTEIELLFPDGRVSRVRAMTSSEAAGHGSTTAWVLSDEHAWNKMAKAAMKAMSAAAGQTGRIRLVSTANGRHNAETGEGNHFHYVWENGEEAGFNKVFLPYTYHPDRPEGWRETAPEALALPEAERFEQYPLTPEEAFTFSQRVFFDKNALLWYSHNGIKEPLYRMDFKRTAPDRAQVLKSPEGIIRVYEEPYADGRYALAADVSTGKGLDYSCAYVVDLGTMGLVAELHAKIDADQLATQLHYLGKYYNTALLAVEDAGGWGEPVIIFLKDGKEGRPPYPAQYRHRQFSRPDNPIHKPFGFPVNAKTRPTVLEGMEQAIREHALPWMTQRLLDECGNFVYQETGTSPRAAEGTHDDCVMACAIVLELYRQRGHFPDRAKRRKPKGPKVLYPWQ
jgi:hypothetical protein